MADFETQAHLSYLVDWVVHLVAKVLAVYLIGGSTIVAVALAGGADLAEAAFWGAGLTPWLVLILLWFHGSPRMFTEIPEETDGERGV